MKTLTQPRSKIELRATSEQKRLIEQAAQTEGINVTAFIFSRVLPEAQRILSDRACFVLNPLEWEQLEHIINRKPRPNERLKSLARTPSVLETRKHRHGHRR